MAKKPVKVAVLCTNAGGEPDFFTYTANVTQEQYDKGEHYEKAKEAALNKNYEEPMIAFDEFDTAANLLPQIADFLGKPPTT